MSYKIAIVGTKETIAGFMALGFETRNAHTAEEARNVLFELRKARQNPYDDKSPLLYAIIFVFEEFLEALSADDYKKICSGALPAVIPLPSHKGPTGFSEVKIRRIVEKAIGVDIFDK